MSLINYMVYSKSKKSTFLPWNIASVRTPTLTFRQHYTCDVQPHCLQLFPDIQCDLEEVYVGTEKERVDVVDPSLVIAEVVPLFGGYVKYAVGHPTSHPFHEFFVKEIIII